MAPKLLKQQVNNDRRKETLFNKSTTYGSETMAGLATLIAKEEINITGLDTMSPAQVKKVSKALKLKKISKKSNIALTDEIKAVARMYVAGQGNVVESDRKCVILIPYGSITPSHNIYLLLEDFLAF